jgi:hypothetical protein
MLLIKPSLVRYDQMNSPFPFANVELQYIHVSLMQRNSYKCLAVPVRGLTNLTPEYTCRQST